MVGAVREGWADAGTYVVILTSFIVFLGLLAKAKPVRYLFKWAVGQPITDWIATDVVIPELKNHEARMRHAVREETRVVISEHTRTEETLASELVGVVGKLSVQLEQAVEMVTARMEKIETDRVR